MSNSKTQEKVPVNIIMGELGSGKTTVILNLVKQLASDDYLVIWLKNEYGDVNVDAKLAQEAGIKTTEIMNGCLCCTAIGNIETALEQILLMKPDRIIIETAGTAHPAPIIIELKRFVEILIDSVTELIDAVNFGQFKEPAVIRYSYSKYVDFVVINKIGLVTDERLEAVLDQVLEVYSAVPIIKTVSGVVPAAAIIGLDQTSAAQHWQPVKGDDFLDQNDHMKLQAFSFCSTGDVFAPEKVQAVIEALNRHDIWRVKGLIKTSAGWQVLNSVFNRITWQKFTLPNERTEILFVGPNAKDCELEIVANLRQAVNEK
ncbi:hypothetical protein KKF05_01510 [Patescibacteria group bacterium]|nr:hypothetical protein [Patescibacteria group bacterium]MBU1029239.1 hypothetical protein [Patescibacteria group bacterium]MBU1916123.1 hypothetical protein [Patescibacteria group bacterium]